MKSIVLLTMLLVVFPLKADLGDEGLKFVEDFSNQALNEIVVAKVPVAEKIKRFKDLFDRNVDMNMIAAFALGRSARGLDSVTKDEFKKEFVDNIVLTWTTRFNEYKGQKIILKSNSESPTGDMFVKSNVVDEKMPNTPPVEIVWRLRKVEGSLKIIDIIIQNISMLKTYQTEYRSFLNQNDGDIGALVTILETKNEKYRKDLGI